MLAGVLADRSLAYTIDAGGGAFYGPKLDFKLVDAIGRKWQGPTVQLDFNLPERFGLAYAGADNTAHRPIMLHRVLVGSMERFVGGLIEHYAGEFPLWLAPEQVRVLTVTDAVAGVATAVVEQLRAGGVRAHTDPRSETLPYRIRDAVVLKVPYIAVIGAREARDATVAVSVRGGGEKQRPTPIPVDTFLALLRREIGSRALTLSAGSL
jgi:threonyl-tRNA synthetase